MDGRGYNLQWNLHFDNGHEAASVSTWKPLIKKTIDAVNSLLPNWLSTLQTVGLKTSHDHLDEVILLLVSLRHKNITWSLRWSFILPLHLLRSKFHVSYRYIHKPILFQFHAMFRSLKNSDVGWTKISWKNPSSSTSK